MERTGSGSSLYEVDAADLSSDDLIAPYEDAYTSAMVRIRAVGEVISRGRKPRNLHVAIESMRQSVATMRAIHNKAGPLLAAESHWCCDRPRSEVMRVGVHITDWTIAVTAIGVSAAGLRQADETNKTMSAVRSVTTLGVAAMHVAQGWFAGKTFEQIAYEEDLMRLLKGSAGRIRYVESMIQTFSAWDTLQKHESSQAHHDLEADVDSLIEALEAVPIRPKSVGDKCRRDVLQGYLATRMGSHMLSQSERLRQYKELVEQETQKGTSTLALEDEGGESEEVTFEDEEVDARYAQSYLKQKKKERSPIHNIKTRAKTLRHRRGDDLPMERRSSPRRRKSKDSDEVLSPGVLDEFIQNKFCCFVSWNIDRVVAKINGKYRVVETESTAVGNALKRHDATDIEFDTSIAALREVVGAIEQLERVAKHILGSEKSIPTATTFRSQQHYRTIIQLVFTGGSLATSIAESVLEFRQEEANETLKTIAFVALLLGQVGARWDNHLQGQIFNKMRDQQVLRGLLARKHGPTTRALIRYWESCQKALTSGRESDVERTFAIKVPRPMTVACTMSDVAKHILDKRKRLSAHVEGSPDFDTAPSHARMREVDFTRSGPPTMHSAALRTAEEEETASDSAFDTRVMELAIRAQRSSEARYLGPPPSPVKTTPPSHEVALDMSQRTHWDEVDSEEEEFEVPEGDWELRLKQLRKLEEDRRRRQAAVRVEHHAPPRLPVAEEEEEEEGARHRRTPPALERGVPTVTRPHTTLV